MSDAQFDGEATSLVYVADPMCSWCYGFEPSLAAVRERWPQLAVSVVMGGLRVQGHPLDQRMKDMLGHHWQEVEARSGQRFSNALFAREGFLYTTEPACRAVITVREQSPELALPMLAAVQRAFYAEGRDTTDAETLTDIAADVGIERVAFARAFDGEAMRGAAGNDFAIVHGWGIRGFPALATLRLRRGQPQGEIVAPGWLAPAELLARVEAALAA